VNMTFTKLEIATTAIAVIFLVYLIHTW